MKLVVIFLGLLVAVWAGTVAPSPKKMNFQDALNYCKTQFGTQLLLSRSNLKNHELAMKARQYAIISGDVSWNQIWLNARRSKSGEFVEGFDGTSLGYSNFIPGEDTKGDCLALNLTRITTFGPNWVGHDCNNTLYFLCEKV